MTTDFLQGIWEDKVYYSEYLEGQVLYLSENYDGLMSHHCCSQGHLERMEINAVSKLQALHVMFTIQRQAIQFWGFRAPGTGLQGTLVL